MRISDWSSDVCSSDLARRAGHDLDGWLIDCINRAVSHHRLAHGNGFIPDGLIFARLAQPNESGQKQVLAYSVRRRSRCGFPGQFSGFLVISIGSRLVLPELGRASGRERVVQYVAIWVVAVSLKKK